MDPGILAFEFPIKSDMSASAIPSLTIFRIQGHLTAELEALNRDFEHTYSAKRSDREPSLA
jgi:hypothetical protein